MPRRERRGLKLYEFGHLTEFISFANLITCPNDKLNITVCQDCNINGRLLPSTCVKLRDRIPEMKREGRSRFLCSDPFDRRPGIPAQTFFHFFGE